MASNSFPLKFSSSYENDVGALYTHVDGFLNGGSDEFDEEVASNLAEIFKTGKTETSIFKYVGFNMKQETESFKMVIDQEVYVANKVEIMTVASERAFQKKERITDKERT